MTSSLDGPRLGPASGSLPKQLVILLHGYGADGNDLVPVAREWAHYLPDAAFLSPHAPQFLEPNYFGGRCWFPLATFADDELEEGVRQAHPVVEAFVKEEAKKLNLPLSSVALAGFSQGTMMALAVGLQLETAPAAIVGFSGHLVGWKDVASAIKVKPPVLLIHGAADEVIPVQALHVARSALSSAGVPVQWQIRPGLAHGIDPEGLHASGVFLRAAFGLD